MPTKTKRSDLLKFHRPKLKLHEAPIPTLKPESSECIRRLSSYTLPKQAMTFPKSRCAAVLVALFVGRMGDLYVLLSRRASTLRTYAGDTSLPGGKWETGDWNLEWTARREAFEEIGLPMDRQKVPLLCALEPFLAGNQLIVTPIVVLVLDNTLQPLLNEVEVSSLFSHPLQSLLSSNPPFPSDPESFELKYHTHEDINWIHHTDKFRMHRFLTGREAGGTKPIFGLTASILIRVATIGYGREPDYEVYAPNQPSHEERIAYALRYNDVFRQAAREEGIDPDRLVPRGFVPSKRERVGEGLGKGRRRIRLKSRL